MNLNSTYKARIIMPNKRVLDDTVRLYRAAVEYFIDLVMASWGSLFVKEMPVQQLIKEMEKLCIRTKKRPETPYDFAKKFPKFPSYLRRAAICFAYGQVSSYMTRLKAWGGTSRAILLAFPGPDVPIRPCIARTCLCVTRALISTMRASRCSSAIPGTG